MLTTQVQSALRGDVEPVQALGEIQHTVRRATELANQMLALAKVEQLRQQGDPPVTGWAGIVRAVALDLAPLIAENRLDFSLETLPAPVRAHEWALRELVRNLLHNAIKNTPAGSRLALTMSRDSHHVALTIADSGAGIADDQRARLFQPFATGAQAENLQRGSGLGLAICQEIVDSIGGSLALENRGARGRVIGLDAIVSLPVAENAAA